MGSQLDFSGVLACGPAAATEDVPAGLTTIPYQTSPAPKYLQATTGDMQVLLNNPSSYVALPGIGGAGVKQATFLYLRTNAAMQVRVTYAGTDGLVQAVEVINGMSVSEVDPASYIELVEVQGAGQVEYFAGGPC